MMEFELFTQRRITQASKIFQRKAREEANKLKSIKNQAESMMQTELRNVSRQAEEQRRKYQDQLLATERKMIILVSEKQHLESMLEKQRKEEAMETDKFRRRVE